MICYRIAHEEYADSLKGYGAYLNGGRWNSKGVSVLYTAESRSLSYLETLVHFTATHLVPKNYKVITLYIRDSMHINRIVTDNYEDYIQNKKENTQTAGDFLLKNNCFAFKAQSFIVKNEHNIMLNPYHTDFKKNVKILDIENFNLDNRLFKIKK